MIKLGLYIDGVGADLFKDETVNLTSSIQSIKDISKIFTDFTQQFTLPASKTNNKIFKHFYNQKVTNSYDARKTTPAIIKLNGVDFRTGNIRLNGVTLENGEVSSYKVVFFGDTIILKNVLGEDKLSQLITNGGQPGGLDDFNHEFNLTVVKEGFEGGYIVDAGGNLVSSNGTLPHLIYPNISHSRRFTIDGSGNYRTVATEGFAGDEQLSFTDLKPALSLHAITNLIQNKYPELVFKKNGFFDTNTFKQLFMWMHSEKGPLTTGDVTEVWSENFANFDYDSGDPDARPLETLFDHKGIQRFYKFRFKVETASSEEYTMRIIDITTGNVLGEKVDVTGDQTKEVTIRPTSAGNRIHNIRVEVAAENTINFTPSVRVRKYSRTPLSFGGFTYIRQTSFYDLITQSTLNEVKLKNQIPEMKVIDFLTNVFKMFNLTAYVDVNGEIVVQPLQEYYKEGVGYDITKYVDTKKVNIDRLLPFNEISFNYKGNDTFLIQNRNEVISDTIGYGNTSFQADSNYDGKPFKIELDFEHMLFEKLTHPTSPTKNVLYGWHTDKDQSPSKGKPLIFFSSMQAVGIDNDIDWNEGGPDSIVYQRPANSLGLQFQSINFGEDYDEFALESNFNSLFATQYLDYIDGIFNPLSRKVKVKATLPLNILNNYTLKDRFIMGNNSYTIDTIKTNLNTGESDLTLITDFLPISDGLQVEDPSLIPVAELSAITVSNVHDEVELRWDEVVGALSYNLYIDDVLIVNVEAINQNGTEVNNYIHDGLMANTQYEAAIEAVYEDDDTSVKTFKIFTTPIFINPNLWYQPSDKLYATHWGEYETTLLNISSKTRVRETATYGDHSIIFKGNVAGININGIRTFSIHIEKSTNTKKYFKLVMFGVGGGGTISATFDLDAVTVDSSFRTAGVTDDSVGITDEGDGFLRVNVTAKLLTNETKIAMFFRNDADNTSPYNGSTSEEMFFERVQLEAGTLTAYKPS